jgi:hypothetical protein
MISNFGHLYKDVLERRAPSKFSIQPVCSK